MPVIINQGNEIYTINKEVFSKSYVYNFSTRFVVGADLFVRVNRDERFNEKEFLVDVIRLFNGVMYPSKDDVKGVAKKFGLIVEGLDYKQMNPGVRRLVEAALKNGYKVEYAYDGVNIGKQGVLIEFKRYDPNLGIFTRVSLNRNGERRKWIGRDIVDDYDEIISTIEKVVEGE